MDTLNELITRGITNSLNEDLTIISDIYEHPEFSTENDLEGIIFDYGNKIQAIRELTRRLDILVHDYDVYLKDELAYKLKNFKEKRERFKKEISSNKSLRDAVHNYVQSDIDASRHFVDDFSQLKQAFKSGTSHAVHIDSSSTCVSSKDSTSLYDDVLSTPGYYPLKSDDHK